MKLPGFENRSGRQPCSHRDQILVPCCRLSVPELLVTKIQLHRPRTNCWSRNFRPEHASGSHEKAGHHAHVAHAHHLHANHHTEEPQSITPKSTVPSKNCWMSEFIRRRSTRRLYFFSRELHKLPGRRRTRLIRMIQAKRLSTPAPHWWKILKAGGLLLDSGMAGIRQTVTSWLDCWGSASPGHKGNYEEDHSNNNKHMGNPGSFSGNTAKAERFGN